MYDFEFIFVIKKKEKKGKHEKCKINDVELSQTIGGESHNSWSKKYQS